MYVMHITHFLAQILNNIALYCSCSFGLVVLFLQFLLLIVSYLDFLQILTLNLNLINTRRKYQKFFYITYRKNPLTFELMLIKIKIFESHFSGHFDIIFQNGYELVG